MFTRTPRGTTVNWTTTFKTTSLDTSVMPKEEFRRLCAALKITNAELAAGLFGLSWRTCQRYWYGDLPIPGPLARLLRLADDLSLSHAAMRKLSRPMTPKDTRLKPPADL